MWDDNCVNWIDKNAGILPQSVYQGAAVLAWANLDFRGCERPSMLDAQLLLCLRIVFKAPQTYSSKLCRVVMKLPVLGPRPLLGSWCK